MPGLCDSTEGLCYAAGSGLEFENGLGGAPGLNNPQVGPPVFVGTGSLRVAMTQQMQVAVALGGAGGLQANAVLRMQLAGTFAGSGGLSATVSLALAARASFPGSGGVAQ